MSKARELYLSVKTFSQAVNNCQPFEKKAMDIEARNFIFGQIISEMTELAQGHIKTSPEDILLEQVDAVVDAMYYIADSAARHGFDAIEPYDEPSWAPVDGIAPMDTKNVKRFLKSVQVGIIAMVLKESEEAQQECLWYWFNHLREKLYEFTGIDALDYFDIVHKANLSKLDAEGKPILLREDGKIMKPEGFVPPNGIMKTLLLSQLYEVSEDAAGMHSRYADTVYRLPEGLSRHGVRSWFLIMKMLEEQHPEIKETSPEKINHKYFYSPAEWKARGETYGLSGELVLIHEEGYLTGYCNLDYCDYAGYELLIETFSKERTYIEQCTSWYSAVYLDPPEES